MSRAIFLFIILVSLTASAIAARVQVIYVGQDNMNQFVPNTVNAVKGDTIAFNFVGGQHDVVQASSSDNCSKMENGFDSGPNPSSNWFNYTVNVDKGRIWFFCSTFTHCKNYNMTGGIIVNSNAIATHPVSASFIIISSIVAIFFMFN
ncbi:Cupredoxin [Gigaspora margarita]|uniref:Cupredoxin n=1 Tax=Gigaspora margarita TaxID=4874 RepID=A0A8H3WU64_GIGMA|nr:Cupredoxin [Gigaspora margarita]